MPIFSVSYSKKKLHSWHLRSAGRPNTALQTDERRLSVPAYRPLTLAPLAAERQAAVVAPHRDDSRWSIGMFGSRANTDDRKQPET